MNYREIPTLKIQHFSQRVTYLSKPCFIFTEISHLLYASLKIIGRLALPIFCRNIVVSRPEALRSEGPLLLAANHPNSFLDAIILDLLFEKPIWSLARGDVFKTNRIRKILRALYILPVYRTSEGVENLNENYQTFNICIELFRNNEVVLIFSEGKCVNEWHLRPLKKGTARLAFSAWDNHIPLTILPVGINYSSFHRYGKTVLINFGTAFGSEVMDMSQPDGLRNQQFNQHLKNDLENQVIELLADDHHGRRLYFHHEPSTTQRVLLSLPAVTGWLLHAPLYYPLSRLLLKKFGKTDHYDSLLFGALLFSYPVYLLLLSLVINLASGSQWGWLLFIIAPLLARAATFLYPRRTHYSRHAEN